MERFRLSRNARYPYAKSWRWSLVKLFDFFVDRIPKSLFRKSFPENVKKILVIRLDHIGDVVCSTVVFPLLRSRFPGARITALVDEAGGAILQNNPNVDELIIFGKNWFGRKGWVSLPNLFKTILILKRARFDVGFDLRGDVRNILLMVAAGVKYKIGYGIGGGAGLLEETGSYQESFHEVELSAQLASGKFTAKEHLRPEIFLAPEEESGLPDLLRHFGLEKTDRWIVVHPEAGYPAKEWGVVAFIHLVHRLLASFSHKIVIVGLGLHARMLAEAFSPAKRVINLTKNLSLRELLVIIKHSEMLIGNDSGPSHLAHTLGVPAVVIASGTNSYERWGIWRDPSRVLGHKVSCSPCGLERCPIQGHPCLSEITADQVLHAAREVSTAAK